MSARGPIAVVGPTASGKSNLGVELALASGDGEIINADSMQVYRGMNIGTAKVTEAERRGVPHHLLDVLDVSESATVAEFQAMARAAIDDCLARGVTPIIVGGSSLYVRAIVDRMEFPGTDPQVRARWEAQLDRDGAPALHAVLAERDAAAAAAILPTNGRRIVRALEVIEITGKPFTATLPAYESIYPDLSMRGIDVPRDVLDVRIAERVERMWESGLVNEVRALGPALAESRTAAAALGYAQALAYLRGACSADEAKTATVAATRKFARRQDRLFRQDPRVQWQSVD